MQIIYKKIVIFINYYYSNNFNLNIAINHYPKYPFYLK